MFSKVAKLFFIICLIFFTSYTKAETHSSKIENFLSLSDIHFDPFLECTSSIKPCPMITKLRHASSQNWVTIFEREASAILSHDGDDTNYALFKSTLVELQKISQKEHPQFVIILGDFLAHDFHKKYKKYSGDQSINGYEAFVKKTLQLMTLKLSQIFPDIDVYPVVGNNDTYTKNYQVSPNGAFLKETAGTWAVFMKDKKNRESFLRTFPTAGYYIVTIPNHPNQRIIVLNTVLFSSRRHDEKTKEAAQWQLNWLHEQLENIKKQKQQSILAYHIPMGVDVYATLKTSLTTTQEFWHLHYNHSFEHELKNYSTIINGILSGHVHVDTFRLIAINKIAHIPVNFTPSISPVYGNDPAFKIYHFDGRNDYLMDYMTYYLPLNTRAAPFWQKEYGH